VAITKQRTGIKNRCLKGFLYAERKQIKGMVIAPPINRYEVYGVSILTLKTVILSE